MIDFYETQHAPQQPLFLNIPFFIAHNEKLMKYPRAIILFGEINSMIQTNGRFWMSNETISKRLGCTESSVKKYLKLLEDEGWIERKRLYGFDKRVIGREICLTKKVKQFFSPVEDNEESGHGPSNYHTGGSQTDHKEKRVRDKKNINNYKKQKNDFYINGEKSDKINKNQSNSKHIKKLDFQSVQEFKSFWDKYCVLNPAIAKKGDSFFKRALKKFNFCRKSIGGNLDKMLKELEDYIAFCKKNRTYCPKSIITWLNGGWKTWREDVSTWREFGSMGFNPKKRVEKGTDWNEKKADTSDLVPEERLRAIFRNFGNTQTV